MRIASFNVENLFERTKVLDLQSWAPGKPVLHPAFDFGPRQGTFRSGNEGDKIDYVLLSPALFARATGGAVFRKGVWRGPRTRNPWPIYDTLTADVHAASDHAAIYADLGL